MQKYRVERITSERTVDFVELYNTVHSATPISLEEARRRFNTIAFGDEYFGFMAYDNKEPIAYYGVFPIHLKLNGQVVLAAQSGDTMTHANYRKQGLFIILAKETYKLSAQKGVKIIYGMPNHNSYHGLIKLGWKEQSKFIQHTVKINPTLKSRCYRKFFTERFKEMPAKKLGVIKNSDMWNMNFGNALTPFHVDRSNIFYNYKLQGGATQLLEFTHGYAFLKIWFSDVYLGDYIVKDKSNELLFWKELKRFSAMMCCYSIIFSFTPDLEKMYVLPTDSIKSEGLSLLLLDLGLNSDENLSLTTADYDTF